MMPSRFLDLGLVQPFLAAALDPPPAAAVAHAVAAAPHARAACVREGASVNSKRMFLSGATASGDWRHERGAGALAPRLSPG